MEELLISGVIGFVVGAVFCALFTLYGKYFGIKGITPKGFINQKDSKTIKLQYDLLKTENDQLKAKIKTLEKALELCS
ncbi:MAG: hypothetical protein ACOYK1_04110 [Vampirovibrionia bacterium]|jgi:hypothetical protein